MASRNPYVRTWSANFWRYRHDAKGSRNIVVTQSIQRKGLHPLQPSIVWHMNRYDGHDNRPHHWYDVPLLWRGGV